MIGGGGAGELGALMGAIDLVSPLFTLVRSIGATGEATNTMTIISNCLRPRNRVRHIYSDLWNLEFRPCSETLYPVRYAARAFGFFAYSDWEGIKGALAMPLRILTSFGSGPLVGTP